MVSQNPEVAVLQSQMTDFSKTVDRIEGKIDGLTVQMSAQNGIYVTKAEFDLYRNNRSLQNFLTIILTTVITSIVGGFVYSIFHR